MFTTTFPRCATALFAVALAAMLATAPVAARSAADDPPVLAYYYIWFNSDSWDRAKSDYPSRGRYDSDDREVMRDHVRWAKEAGLDGFIVSWKATDDLNPRLAALVDEARLQDFKLAIIYQGLDFDRRPQPVARVAEDLRWFVERYGNDPVFQVVDKPIVIWNGTEAHDVAAIERVTGPLRSSLRILAAEKSVAGVRRVGPYVDGNAYYWSSLDPERNPRFAEKLVDMAAAVHDHGGIWLAPAAPGYDSRTLGGDSVVQRRDGETLRARLAGARGSNPDVIGLISWNEFSENTHVEPSERYGTSTLATLAEELGRSEWVPPAVRPTTKAPPADGSDAEGSGPRWTGIAALATVILGLVAAFAVASRAWRPVRR